jgi:hypothetical protein
MNTENHRPQNHVGVSVLRGKKGAASTLRDEGKRGSCVDNHSRIQELNPYWYYCWAPQPAENAPPVLLLGEKRNDNDGTMAPVAIDFLPMFWEYYPYDFLNRLKHVLIQNPLMILGFNEPDKKDQSNIPVEKALEGWSVMHKTINEREATNKPLLVSPSCADPLGPWMETFMRHATSASLQIDVIGVHYYGGPNAEVFLDRMITIYEKYGRRPLLLTEFGVADWQAQSPETNRFSPVQVLAFMQIVLPWMETQNWILGYNWFPFQIDNPHGTCSALYDKDGILTPLGRFYAFFHSDNGSSSTTTD